MPVTFTAHEKGILVLLGGRGFDLGGSVRTAWVIITVHFVDDAHCRHLARLNV